MKSALENIQTMRDDHEKAMSDVQLVLAKIAPSKFVFSPFSSDLR